MRQRILVALLIAAGSAAIAYAQSQPAPDAPRPGADGPGREFRQPLTRADAEKKVAERFAAVDLNHDGFVTRDELAAAGRTQRDKMHAFMEARMKERRDGMFDRLDTNHDGSISREEFAAAAPPRPGPGGAGKGNGPDWRGPMDGHRMAGGPGGPDGPRKFPGRMGGPALGEHWFEQADANHDNKVTLAEAKASALVRFDKLDTNHDGTIEPEERRMAFREFRNHGRGPDAPGRQG